MENSPIRICQFFVSELGNSWANENLFLAAEGVMWFRFHNYVASRLQMEHPDWSDQKLFLNARKHVVATFQVHAHARTRTHARTCTHTHTHAHTHTHTHTDAHTYAHTRSLSNLGHFMVSYFF